jgi:SAM-dependent methyltransferase/acyl carrier protein
MLARGAKGRPFRILEVGGGNAIMTGLIAERLAASGASVEYVFTDIGRTFVATAEARARERGYPFMSFRTFDISRDPSAQGLEPGSFDAVIGLDVVHATPSIRDTVGHLDGLLADGGLMCLVESSRTYRWNDMVWGLAEGWWMFQDAGLRNPNSPLLSTSGWEAALADSGFTAVTAFPRSAAARARTLCSLVVAQRGQVAREGSSHPRDRHVLAALARIRRQAGGLIVRQVDVADDAAMERLVRDAEAQFGAIHGVVHAAAVEHKSLIASRQERVEDLEFRPKVDGTLVLDRVFRSRPLDFMALYSSITGVIGGGGQVGYCGANAFLDAFASERARRRSEPTVSINWGRWQGAGLARDFESWHEARTGETLSGGMTAEEGIDALRRVIAHRVGPRIAVMTHEWRPEAGGPAAAPPAAVEIPPASTPTGGGDVEARVAAIWRQLLGAAPFGVHTPFQEVGGDSLVGIQLVARIREQFGVQLPIQAVFDAPTIAELSARILAAGAEEIEEGAL